ncbi:MAG: chorismate mutase [Oscillospiraceae bacterium]|nr:chorismate mutase [Oscillospiraceae bacterium]
MSELDQARESINRIDREMAKLFEERMKCCEVVCDFKQKHGLSIRDEAREAEVIRRNLSYVDDPVIGQYYVQFIRNNIELSCSYQARLMSGMRVAYSGVEGAFAHIAAARMFPGAQLVAYRDFPDAYEAVERGEADCAVLPLENSYAGEVGAVMDLMFSGELFVNQVIDVGVEHCLLGVKGASIGDVRTVISHPQALGQCDGYISRHGFEMQEYSNTAAAAKYVRDLGDPTVAAIASAETAELYGLDILESHINISSSNTTRFGAFSRAQNSPKSSGKREDENFILMFTVQNEAGALAQTLNIIGSHGYNMRSLRSRPMKDLLWNYYFYVEAEGSIGSANGSEMMQELSATCAKLKLAGAYYSDNAV